MPGPVKNFIGREGFIWFLGVVEDRNDPEKLGRVRVRCFGWHSQSTTEVPTELLPWASVMFSANVPATYTPKEGDYVFGFFLDADSAQNPVVVGVIPGKPEEKPDPAAGGFRDPRTNFSSAPTKEPYPLTTRLNEPTTNRLARGRTDGTVIEKRKRIKKTGITGTKGISWSEPDPSYGALYPFNYAQETESGHAFELDDTKGAERVHLAHKDGTAIEFNAKGNRIDKVVKDQYYVIMGDDFVYIGGKYNLTVAGDCNMKVNGKLNVEAAEINMASSGDIKMRAGGSMKLESGGATHIKAGGAIKVGGGGKATLKGSSASIGGSSINFAGKVSNKVMTKQGPGKILPKGSASSPSSSGLSLPGGGGGFGGGGFLGSSFGATSIPGLGGNPLAGTISGDFSSFQLSMDNLQGQISGEISNLTGQLQGSFSDLQNGFASQIGGIQNDISGSIDTLQNNLSGSLSGLQGQLTASLPNFQQPFTSITSAINNQLGDFTTSLSGVGGVPDIPNIDFTFPPPY